MASSVSYSDDGIITDSESDSDDGVDSDDIEEIFSDYEDWETQSDSDSDCELIWSDSD